MSKMKLLSTFLFGNTKINILANFVYEVLRNYTKLDEFCCWKQQSSIEC